MTLFYSCPNLAYAKNEPGGIWKEEILFQCCKNSSVSNLKHYIIDIKEKVIIR